MRIMLCSVQVLGVSCLLIGCGGDLYERQSWVPPAETEKITSDWDVASGMCDKKALGTELTEEEQALAQADQVSTQQSVRLTNSVTDTLLQGRGDPTLGAAIKTLGVVSVAMSSFSGATAEEQKKSKTFRQCMEKLDWKMKDNEEDSE